MTPMQTLVRLAELTRQIDHLERQQGDHLDELSKLTAERDRIVAAVPSVPRELEGCNDASLWAHIFEQRYPCTAPQGIIEVWFAAALAGGRLDGIKEGGIAGQAQRTAAQGAAVKTLELVAAMLDGGSLPDIRLRGTDPAATPTKLSAVIAETLTAAL